MTTPKDLAELVDELRLIGCHANGDSRCTCGIGQDAADLITAQAEENRRLRATLSAITATDCYSRDECTAMARAALSSTGEKG